MPNPAPAPLSAPPANHRGLGKQVGAKENRKLKARRRRPSIWFGFGMFGVVGWSVAVPILLVVLLGRWLDTVWPSQYSWTLMLLLGGVVMGCLNAWHWVQRERQLIEDEEINGSTPPDQETPPHA